MAQQLLGRALLTLLVFTVMTVWHEPSATKYVPKSQRSATSSMALAAWGIFTSWSSKWFSRLETKVHTWDTRASKLSNKKTIYHPARKKRRYYNVAKILCLAYHATNQYNQVPDAVFDTDSVSIKVDNCASAAISNDKRDFIDKLIPCARVKVKGLVGYAPGIVMKGTIQWKIDDDNGVPHTLTLPGSYYVANATAKLLSPQHWAQVAKDNRPLPRGTWCGTYDDGIILQWNQRKFQRTLKFDPSTNVATLRTSSGYERFEAYCTEIGVPDNDLNPATYPANLISDDEEDDPFDSTPHRYEQVANQDVYSQRDEPLNTDFNLDGPAPPAVVEDEEDHIADSASASFLKWHHRLGHMSPTKMRIMARMGMLPSSFSDCPVPLCTSCLFGKATKRPWRTKTPSNKGDPSKTVTKPGDCVSVDQLESSTPGLIAQMKGKPTVKRYKVATVFVDHFSRLSYLHLQKTTSAEETVEAKDAFERFAASHGVQVRHYHADNGRFADNKFRKAVSDNRQTISFCGVNAHFQNGVAERRIRELQDHARTMLIHARRRWPKAITANLWPYALRMANDLHQIAPAIKPPQSIPIEKFSGSKVTANTEHWHHFGSPVYVLDSDLASGKKIDKWSERARVGIYLGRSSQHARTVALVLSLSTGLTSPQFHLKVDSTFQTMRASFGHQPPQSQWQKKCGFVLDPESTVLTPPSVVKTPDRQSMYEQLLNLDSPISRLTASAADLPASEGEGILPSEGVQPRVREEARLPSREPVPPPEGDAQRAPQTQQPASQPVRPERTTRSGRSVRPPARLIEALSAHHETIDAPRAHHHWDKPSYVPYETLVDDYDEGHFSEQHPMVAYTASSDPDTMYHHEAMRQPDRQQFIEAMEKEVLAQEGAGNWTLTLLNKVPQGSTILPAVWQMKRKRRISTREVYKHKARLNIDGSKQTKGLNYWDTYSPVASWSTIRMVLIMALIGNWQTRQIDFVLAYTQADAECDNMYMKIPRGFEVDIPQADPKDYVLKINKNIYGQKQAGRVWNKYLVIKLKQVGFIQSEVDPCIFYCGKSIYVLYTDDSILTGPDPKELDQITANMEKVGLHLTVEGDISDFLGVKIQKNSDGTVSLTQPHLIDQILADLRLNGDNVTTKDTPAISSQTLFRYESSPDFDGHFNYRSVIGKLGYLCSTRPDISYAVHQCARFSANPKNEHAKALKWLGRYLLGTKERGLIYEPQETSFDCYVDADFAGNWNQVDAAADIDTARSRTGYIIYYANCPLIWASKLQTQVALSTTEAEYIALSTALRELIPIMELLKEMKRLGFKCKATTPTIHCTAFEDNSGCLILATEHKLRPRTKHINCALHHFRSYVDSGEITIKDISTILQRADMLTKPNNLVDFQRHRKATMGW